MRIDPAELRALLLRHGVDPGTAEDVVAEATATTWVPAATPPPHGERPALAAGARYTLGPVLGQGGMAEVREAYDARLRRTLAMKILLPHLAAHPDLVERFEAEALITGQLEHPGIVPVHDAGTTEDGRPYFTMRRMPGQTLQALIDTHGAGAAGAWSMRRLVEALRAVCQTVAYAHDQGLLHRDLKPANILIGTYGEVMVADWGLVRVDRPTTAVRVEGTGITLTGRVAGTPGFMAPEQARGEALSPAADV